MCFDTVIYKSIKNLFLKWRQVELVKEILSPVLTVCIIVTEKLKAKPVKFAKTALYHISNAVLNRPALKF